MPNQDLEAQVEAMLATGDTDAPPRSEEIDKVKRNISKSEAKAQELMEDPEETEKVLEKALRKTGKASLLAEAVDDLTTLIRMIRAFIRRDYTQIPVGSIIAALGAVIYFVSPVDAFPDFVPVLGLGDDAAVIAGVTLVIKSDIDHFRVWEAAQPE